MWDTHAVVIDADNPGELSLLLPSFPCPPPLHRFPTLDKLSVLYVFLLLVLPS